MLNQRIRALENSLIDTLNASGFPPEVLRIVLGKLEAQMTILSNQEIQKESETKDAESLQSD